MADVIISPNMNLPVPIVGQDPGPDWANNINASLGILDQHNHSAGQGVQINPNGLDINADLTINGNNLTFLNTVRFNNLTGSIAGTAPNLGCIYEAVNDLYYNDGVGNVIQLTKAGSVNATSSGISSGTATASFVGSVLVVDANVNTPANVQGASFLFGNNVSGSNYLTLQPPAAMGSNYSVTLPPINTSGNTVLLTYDTSNNIGIGPSVSGGISGSNITPGTITQNLLAPRPASQTALAGGIAISPSCGVFTTTSIGGVPVTNLSVTLTTTGRPVQLMINDDSSGNASCIGTQSSGVNSLSAFEFFNGVTLLTAYRLQVEINGASTVATLAPSSSLQFLDLTVNGSPGTYTYTLQIASGVAGTTATIQYSKLIAYEI